MKQDKTMHILPRGTKQQARDIMDNQDNASRGDGERKPAEKVMTTFQMDKQLKERLKSHCQSQGIKLGEFINRAIRQALEEQ